MLTVRHWNVLGTICLIVIIELKQLVATFSSCMETYERWNTAGYCPRPIVVPNLYELTSITVN